MLIHRRGESPPQVCLAPWVAMQLSVLTYMYIYIYIYTYIYIYIYIYDTYIYIYYVHIAYIDD